MGQLNIHMTPEFEKELNKFMKGRKIPTKAEAIRTAIKEGLEQLQRSRKQCDFSSWAGLGKSIQMNSKPKFKSDDDLWK